MFVYLENLREKIFNIKKLVVFFYISDSDKRI